MTFCNFTKIGLSSTLNDKNRTFICFHGPIKTDENRTFIHITPPHTHTPKKKHLRIQIIQVSFGVILTSSSVQTIPNNLISPADLLL